MSFGKDVLVIARVGDVDGVSRVDFLPANNTGDFSDLAELAMHFCFEVFALC
tara:strand:+ start:136 stop:291 length:156 start_codon:yes stop_codon:yes gene_type:complete